MMEKYDVVIHEDPYMDNSTEFDDLTEQELLQLLNLSLSHGLFVTVIGGS